MSNGTKIIEASRKGQSFKIRLKDNNGGNNDTIDIETGVDPNDTVRWQLAEESGLASLEGVYTNNKEEDKPHFGRILESNPTEMTFESGQKYFEGKVKSISPGKGKIQFYMIGFKVPGDDNTYWEDPKLHMNN